MSSPQTARSVLRRVPIFVRRILVIAAFSPLLSVQALVTSVPANQPEVDWRFLSGMGTANPTPNTSPLFLGAGYDWSAIGGRGWGGSGRLSNGAALLSPMHMQGAQHSPLSTGAQVDFFNGQTSQRIRTTVASASNIYSDVSISTLTNPFAASDNIGVLRMLDISSGNYANQPGFIMGTGLNAAGQNSGTQEIASIRIGMLFDSGNISVLGYYSDPSLTYMYSETGDSGSPLLITYKGQLTMAGSTWYSNGVSSSLLNKPNEIATTNLLMASDGYALRFTIYDIPSDSANTAAVWTGGSGTGNFTSVGNWSGGVVPVEKPVVFDSSANGGQSLVNLGGNQSIRGALFRPNTNLTGGFAFADDGVLSIGTSGIRNEDSNTQTFHSDISLLGSQNWEAVAGDLIFNGDIVNNGNLLVVQGAGNTTLNGVLSGTGGLAKDEAGVLTLNARNTYTGMTFIHNGVVRLGIDNALSASTSVRFDVANPAMLDLNGKTLTVGDVRSVYTGSGVIALGGGSLITGGNDQSTTYAGVFTGSGSVTKEGLGTWVLTGDSSSFTGAMMVSEGTLQISNLAGSASGSGAVIVNQGATLSGTGTVGGQIVLNSGATLSPGVSGVGTLHSSGGLLWNGGGIIDFTLNAPGTSTVLNLGTSALTKGTFGNYLFNFVHGGGIAPGLYTLMQFGSTNFNVADFGYTNSDGFVGNFLLNSGNLQFQLQSVGTSADSGGWQNFTPNVTADYSSTANWKNGVINNRFVENIQSGFKQAVLFDTSTTLSGPLVINFNSMDTVPPGGSPVASKGWYFLSKTSTLSTLTLGGDIEVNNRYTGQNPTLPGVMVGAQVGPTVSLGGKTSAIIGAGNNLAAIDLGGATRTISTNMRGDSLYSTYGFFIEAPITDVSGSGAGLIKKGTGNVILGAANTFTGDLRIEQGMLSLIGNGTIASKNIYISGGSVFSISNTARDMVNGVVSVPNRLTAAGGANLIFRGGDLEFAGTAGQTLSVNSVDLQQGLSILHPDSNSGASATLAMNSLLRSKGATLVLSEIPSANAAGTSGANVKTSTLNGAAPPTGTVIPWAYTVTANRIDDIAYTGFAVYNTTYGFQASNATTNANYLSGTNFSGISASTDYQLTASLALAADAEINSLVMGSGSNVALTSSGTPRTLKINSGGLLFTSGGTIGSATAANNVTLDFAGKEALLAVAGSAANIYAPIRNANGLTVSGSMGSGFSSVNLIFSNPFNTDNTQTAYNWGDTFINGGRLVVQNANALPSTGSVTVNTSTYAVNPGSSRITSVPAVLDMYGNSITIGALKGDGLVAFAPMFNGPKGKLSGTLTLGNGGGSGSFSGMILDTLLPLQPYGLNQGNQLSSYSSMGNMVSLGVTKTGTGTQTFSGKNRYTGATTINGGTLALSGEGTAGIRSALSLIGVGSSFDVSASTTSPTIGSLAGEAGTIVSLGANTLAMGSNGGSTTFSGTITGTGGIRKEGAGIQTFSGSNTYTGATEVNGGTLRLDHSSSVAPLLSASSPLIMSGGELEVMGSASTGVTESPGNTQIRSGASSVQVMSQSGQNTTLALGTISRDVGGTIDFSTSGSGARITTLTVSDGSFLGGYATVNGMNDWAAVKAGRIVAASSISGLETVSNNVATWTAGSNVVSASGGFQGTTGANSSVNSILFRAASASQIDIADTLTIASGGVLVSQSVGRNDSRIDGGILQTGNGQDLVFIQNNTRGVLDVGATIYGSGGLTKSGVGTLVISGNDIHYGATTVNDGTISVIGNSTLGSSSSLTIRDKAMVDFSQTSAAQIFTQVDTDGVMILGQGGLLLGANDSSSDIRGFLSGTGGVTKNGSGTLNVSGLTKYTGPLVINAGTVAVHENGTLGAKSAVTINSDGITPAILDLSNAASAVSIGSLSGNGNLILSPVGLTVGTDNTSTTFGGYIAGAGGITKVGNGTLTLSGTDVSVANSQYRTPTAEGLSVNGGTVRLDYRQSATNKIQTDGSLSMGGGKLVAIGNESTAFTQNTAYWFYINAGASRFEVRTPEGGAADFTFNLNVFSRSTGGTIDFTTIDGGGGGQAYLRVQNTALSNSLLGGGYTTVNNMSDWATFQTVDTITKVLVPMQNAVALQAVSSSGSTITVTDASLVRLGQTLAGANIPAGATVTAIAGNVLTLSSAPTGAVSTLSTDGYMHGTRNDVGAAISSLDNVANWSTANFGANLSKANLTDETGFNGTLASSATINSLRLNAAAGSNIVIASGQTLTVASGGILETANVGNHAVTISGGTLRSGNGKDLIFIQNNTAAAMTVSSALTNDGVTKSGAGELILSGTNSYSGATTVNEGRLSLGGSSRLGNGNSAVTVMEGAILDLRGSSSTTQSFGSLSSMGSRLSTGGGRVILGSSISTLSVGSDNNSTYFAGVIENGAGSTAGLTKVGSGVLSLAGQNTYVGTTNINAGTLLLADGSTAGSVMVGNGSAIASLAGTGSVGDVTVNSTSSTRYGSLTVGTPVVGPYTIASAGVLTTGNLTFQGANSQINFLLGRDTLAGGTYSMLEVMGNLSFNDATLNIVALDGFGAGVYQLFSYTGTQTGSLTLGSLPSGFDAERLTIQYGEGRVDLIVAVPEPTISLLFGAGVLLLLTLPRRRLVRI